MDALEEDALVFHFDDDVEALLTPMPSTRPLLGRLVVPRVPDSSDASMPNLVTPPAVRPLPASGIRMEPPTTEPAKTKKSHLEPARSFAADRAGESSRGASESSRDANESSRHASEAVRVRW